MQRSQLRQTAEPCWPGSLCPWGGVAMFSALLLSLPLLNASHLSQLQALNRELGKLCSNPPQQAHNVCRLHARLVNTL